MVTPTFKILKLILAYERLPDFSVFGLKNAKIILTRATIVVLCCSLAYLVPDLGQFLNFQGSITGILMTFVFPIVCYFKTHAAYITHRERVVCYVILAYGIVGGMISATYAFWALVKSGQGHKL
jgi:hypothetical protein